MTKVILDTNVIIDYLASRAPFYVSAGAIVDLIVRRECTGYITASGVTDIYYVLRKNLTNEACRSALRWLFRLFTVIPVLQVDCETALGYPMEDYEDALVAVCANKTRADYIITRDEHFLKTENVVSPSDFLSLWTSL
jgi:predicted nucleic acid-binding protein